MLLKVCAGCRYLDVRRKWCRFYKRKVRDVDYCVFKPFREEDCVYAFENWAGVLLCKLKLEEGLFDVECDGWSCRRKKKSWRV